MKLRTILTVTYPHEAHLVKGYLESNGIEVVLQDEITAQVNSLYSSAIGGVKIQVSEADLDEGMKVLESGGFILKNAANKTADMEVVFLDSSTNKKVCPFCNSENMGKKRDPNLLVLVVYLFLGFMFPIFKAGYHCYDCGKQWKFKKH